MTKKNGYFMFHDKHVNKKTRSSSSSSTSGIFSDSVSLIEMFFNSVHGPVDRKQQQHQHLKHTFGQCIPDWDVFFNPLPSGTLAAFFLTAVGPIQHTKEGDISREKMILMTSLRLERAAAVRWRQLLITSLTPKCKGQCVQSNVMTQVRANRAAAVTKRQ